MPSVTLSLIHILQFLTEKGWGDSDTPLDMEAILSREREKTWDTVRDLLKEDKEILDVLSYQNMFHNLKDVYKRQANNAAAAGAFAPLLALGIPGSGTGAVLLGGLMMWGLNPGPLLFSKSPDFAWGLIASLYLSNILTLIVALCVIPFLIRILTVPVTYMIPIITVVCVVGSYSTSNSLYGVVIMFLSLIHISATNENKIII